MNHAPLKLLYYAHSLSHIGPYIIDLYAISDNKCSENLKFLRAVIGIGVIAAGTATVLLILTSVLSTQNG